MGRRGGRRREPAHGSAGRRVPNSSYCRRHSLLTDASPPANAPSARSPASSWSCNSGLHTLRFANELVCFEDARTAAHRGGWPSARRLGARRLAAGAEQRTGDRGRARRRSASCSPGMCSSTVWQPSITPMAPCRRVRSATRSSVALHRCRTAVQELEAAKIAVDEIQRHRRADSDPAFPRPSTSGPTPAAATDDATFARAGRLQGDRRAVHAGQREDHDPGGPAVGRGAVELGGTEADI